MQTHDQQCTVFFLIFAYSSFQPFSIPSCRRVIRFSCDFPAFEQALSHQLHHTNCVLHIGPGLSEPILGYTFSLLCIARVHNALKHVSETLWFTTDTVLLPHCAIVHGRNNAFGNLAIYFGLYSRKFKRRLVSKSEEIAASSNHILPVILNHGLKCLKQLLTDVDFLDTTRSSGKGMGYFYAYVYSLL